MDLTLSTPCPCSAPLQPRCNLTAGDLLLAAPRSDDWKWTSTEDGILFFFLPNYISQLPYKMSIRSFVLAFFVSRPSIYLLDGGVWGGRAKPDIKSVRQRR